MFHLADDEILPEVSLDDEESDDPVGLQGVVPGSLPVDWLRVPLAPYHLLRQICYDNHFIMRNCFFKLVCPISYLVSQKQVFAYSSQKVF